MSAWRTLVLPALSVVPAVCCGPAFAVTNYEFSTTDTLIERGVRSSVARVFLAEGETNHVGAATLIDRDSGVAVTVAHILKDQAKVWLEFPNAPSVRLPASVLIQIPRSDQASDVLQDFAVLQTDPALIADNHLAEIEISLDAIKNEKSYTYYGFARSSTDPMAEELRGLNFSEECDYRTRANVMYGDSGSPVVTSEGLSIALLQSGIDAAGRPAEIAGGVAAVLPLSCASDRLIKIVGDSVGSAAWKKISDSSDDSLGQLLQPPPDDASWISNLTLASAIQYFASADTAQSISAKKMQMITDAIIDRRVGRWLLERFYAKSIANPVTRGDTLQKYGDAARRSGNMERAEFAYLVGQSAFMEALVTNQQALSQQQQALVFKSLADVNLALADIGGTTTWLAGAKSYAARAITLAPDGPFRGSAFGTLGMAFQQSGEQQRAIESYTSAATMGYQPSWLARSYNWAFQQRDNVADPQVSNDYEPLGHYQALDRVLLDDLSAQVNLPLT